jgi:hypothetical protein
MTGSGETFSIVSALVHSLSKVTIEGTFEKGCLTGS